MPDCKPRNDRGRGKTNNDAAFIDRLKQVSRSLAALGKKLPSQQQLEDAGLTRGELSARIPRLDLDLHKAKVEQRTRPLRPDEPIDLARLAISADSLPRITNQENPAPEEIDNVVSAFFSQLDWVAPNEDTGEGAPKQAEHAYMTNEVRAGGIDLAVLDR